MRYQRLTVEAILKSLLCGLTVALGVDFVLGTVLWFVGGENPPLTIGLLCAALAVVTIAGTAIFYFAKFKPSVVTNARRIDKLGLEERAVTMIEYKDSDSVITRLQREDAIKALKAVNEKTIKFEFGKKIIIPLIVSSVLGVAMSVIAILSALGLMPSGVEMLDTVIPDEPPIYIPVSYVAEDGGYIDGEIEQLVLLGENAETVVAIPEDGYSFEGWDDGYKKPTRTDEEIDHPLVLTAIFVPLEEDGEDPGDDGEGDEGGEEAGEQEGEGEQESQDGQEGDSDQESDQNGSSGNGKYNRENQIIDGNTYYREFLEEYKDTIMEILKKSTEELTEEERAIIEAYINIV
jgi:hypothetical protein